MPLPGSLIIISTIEPYTLNEEYLRSHWPLHIVLVPWFDFADVEQLSLVLGQVASVSKPFTATVGGQELLGPDRTIPVNVFQDQRAFEQLHEQLSSKLEQLDIHFQEPEWMHANYRAHITRQKAGDRHRDDGDVAGISNFVRARLTSPTSCKIIASFPFHEATA